jgi:tetratricopeptide (TPR) repeat protein
MAALYSRMRSYRRPYLFVRLWFRLLPALCAGVLLTVALCSAQSTADSPDDPDLALEEARHALLSGQYERVDDLTSAAAETDPRAGVLRARAASARGQHDEAIRYLAPHAARDDAAALELGLVFLRVGKDAEGTALLQRILARGNAADLASQFRAARAAHALGLFERANERFREIAGVAGNEPEIQSAWGDLLLEKHNRADAARSFRAALQGNRRYPPAYLGLAKAISDDDPDSARQLVERALTLNPVFVPALVFMAELHLDARDRQGAGDWIGRALAVDPTSLEARSLQAAVAWVEDRRDEFERLAQDILASNPKYGEVYRVAGAHAARHYRFEEAVELTRRALALDPESPAANAELGMHLLRTGDEQDARAALDRAFRADPYDAVTYNLLGLLDTLDTFVTIEDGPIIMRLHPDEAPVLREHALPIARRALTTLSERYGFTPRGPILIEIFPRHDDFAVRTLGLPGMVGALGACFGRVVTLDSPRARPPGTFNWQATLWHELTHVITLQMSNQRVPRWLTEGISIFEERRARPAWGPDLEVSFVDMMTRDEVTPLAELNHAFTRPDGIALAYYHASLVVEFIVSKWGDAGLQRLLKAYGEGLEDDAAFGRALETTAAELDVAFRASMDERFAGLRAALDWPEDSAPVRGAVEDLRTLVDQHPRSYSLLMLFADALQREGRPEEAMAAYERAAALVPTTGEESALTHLAELAESTGDRVRAAAALEQLLARDDTNVEAARRLVALLDPEAERDRWLAAHERVAELDPFDAASHTVLGREALGAGDYDNAVRWLRVALSSRPKDAVAAHCDLAEAYLGLLAPGDAKRQALAALEIAPTYPRAQDLLLTIVEGRP